MHCDEPQNEAATLFLGLKNVYTRRYDRTLY